MSRDQRDKSRSERRHASTSSSHRSSRRDEERSSRHGSKLPKGAKKITKEDYFLCQKQFRVWLAQSKNKYVDDLSTDEAIELFTDEFAKKWNRGKLSKMFYQGLPDAVVEQTKRSRHQWGFVSKLGDREKFELATAKDSVDVATKKKNLLVSDDKAKGGREEEEGGRSRSRRRAKENGEGDREGDKKRRKLERRRDREYRDVVMDELAPRATGREAQIEKRRQVGDKLHGAARDREDTRDGLDLSDAFLMGGGGGDDDLKRRMAQRDVARRRKQEEQQDKLAGLKESARMDKFLEDMGLAGPNANGGKPMTIAPRR